MGQTVDPVIELVRQASAAHGFILRTLLFGSRARGDARENSDYDFAFELKADADPQAWARFCDELRENNPRLNSLDLLRWDQTGAIYRERIKKEGKVIYEQSK